jgi:hypothetical protein
LKLTDLYKPVADAYRVIRELNDIVPASRLGTPIPEDEVADLVDRVNQMAAGSTALQELITRLAAAGSQAGPAGASATVASGRSTGCRCFFGTPSHQRTLRRRSALEVDRRGERACGRRAHGNLRRVQFFLAEHDVKHCFAMARSDQARRHRDAL